MADIVAGLIVEADEQDQLQEHAVWAVMHLCEMVRGLRGLYREPPDEGGTTS